MSLRKFGTGSMLPDDQHRKTSSKQDDDDDQAKRGRLAEVLREDRDGDD